MQFEEKELELITKINKDAAEKAAIALEQMISKKVAVNYQDIAITPLQTVEKITDDSFIAICKVSGDVEGNILLLYKRNECFSILERLMMVPEESIKDMDEDAMSAFKELINIIGGVYLSSIANNLQMEIFPEPPKFIGEIQEIKRELLSELEQVAEEILSVDTELVVDEYPLEGHLFIILEGSSLKKILTAMKS
ncbi:MAG: chemotaxis protein CheC [Candidatus Woesearchaeota archaeon]